MKAEVRVIDGHPELFLGGRRHSRMAARAGLPGEEAPHKIRQYALSDIDVFFTELNEPCSLGWDGTEDYDFRLYDRQLERMVREKSDLRLILYCGAPGGAPYAWARRHSDQLALIESGERLNMPSFGSRLWREDLTRAFRRFVEHMESSPFAEHIIGYNPIYVCNEWFGLSLGKVLPEDGFDDFSEPMREHFREWLRARYGDDPEALREAWGRSDLTFAGVSVPTGRERLLLDDPALYSTLTASGRRLADYYRCYHEAGAELALACCRAVKETLPEPKLVGLMHAYSWGGPHMGAYSQDFAHGAGRRILEAPEVDFLHSPESYLNRNNREGDTGCSYSQQATDSVLRHGKLHFSQWDTRTYLAVASGSKASRGRFHDYSPDQTIEHLKRNLAHQLGKNCHAYWHEAGPGNVYPIRPFGTILWGPLHFDDEPLRRLVPQFKAICDTHASLGSEGTADVALFLSNEEQYYRRPERVYMNLFAEALRSFLLPDTGTPFDDYLLEDFPLLDRSYKVYLFVNAGYVPTALRRAIHQRLAGSGATALWFYAPGLHDERGPDLAKCADLTGLSLGWSAEREFLQVELEDAPHPLLRGLPAGLSFGSDCDPAVFQKGCEWWTFPNRRAEYRLTPVFHACDPAATVLGRLRHSGRPGLAIKTLEVGWTSVYCAAPLPPVGLLRNLFRAAGVHLYAQEGDLVYANSRFLSLTAHGEGSREVHLPRPCRVTDYLTGRVLVENSAGFSVEARHSQTHLFRLDPVAVH